MGNTEASQPLTAASIRDAANKLASLSASVAAFYDYALMDSLQASLIFGDMTYGYRIPKEIKRIEKEINQCLMQL